MEDVRRRSVAPAVCFGNCYGAPMTFGILFAALLLIGWVLWDAF